MRVSSGIAKAILLAAALFADRNSDAASSLDANNWPQFRGWDARGIAANPNLPDRWSATDNAAWKTEIPGRGWSSPIVWGNHIFLTTAVNLGAMEPPKKGLYIGGERFAPPASKMEWKTLCLDLLSGKLLWEALAHQGPPPGPIHIKNSYASETPVTDGERVYAMFGNVGVFCYDMEGHEVWHKTFKPYATRYGWGPSASPALHGDRLFILNDNEEKSYLMALDTRTGKEIWRMDRDEKSNWASPFVWETAQRAEIITPGSRKTLAYDLDGKLLWSLKGMSGITIATPYADQDLLYLSSGYVGDKNKPLYAIRPGASGDISLQTSQTSSAAIAWRNPNAAPYNPTTLVYDGRLYVLYDRGLLSAFNAKTGAPLYERAQLPKGLHFTASPWAYNGLVFCLNEDGLTFVVKAGDQFELLRTNPLSADDMGMATPAISGDRLLIRTSARIYCIRKPSPTP